MVLFIFNGGFALIVIFQPELRRGLEQLGTNKFTNVAGPANTYFRYVLPYATALFTIVPLVLLEVNKNFRIKK